MQSSLRNRLTWGPVMSAAVLGILWLDSLIEHWTAGAIHTPHGDRGISGVGVLVLMLVLIPLATRELAALFAAERVETYPLISGVGTGLLVLHAFLTQFPKFQPIGASSLAFIIVCVMILAALRRAWGKQTQQAITHMSGTVLATLYFGGLGWFLLALRVKHSDRPGGFQGSTWVIVTILLVVKLTDVGAYFGGRAIGRHELIPWLSPQKTWEGLASGLALAALVGLGCSMWVPILIWWKALIFGAVIGFVGQLGDLLESLMKRDAEVKDSGQLVPGFGGLLDIIDSPLLAAPVAYLLFSLF